VKFNDAVFGLVLLALALAVFIVTGSYPTVPAQRVGPGLFPSLIAVGLAVSGALLIIRGWRQRATVPAVRWDPWLRSQRHVAGFVAVIATVALYVAAVDRVGFVLMSFTILALLLRTFTVPWPRSIAIAAVSTMVIHFAFYKLLRVPLPWGILAPYAW
jgi:putative tricarboxylic transport membrane protein